ncbi:hypothetical protein HHI36_023752 [Cryptolaemus montrouzieri]|uniref:Uncharacterized protein n=1 Tax=Cryptolaemus montrouzieri TaxID=559131 RepID=A0ABD2PIV0_9CUCU
MSESQSEEIGPVMNQVRGEQGRSQGFSGTNRTKGIQEWATWLVESADHSVCHRAVSESKKSEAARAISPLRSRRTKGTTGSWTPQYLNRTPFLKSNKRYEERRRRWRYVEMSKRLTWRESTWWTQVDAQYERIGKNNESWKTSRECREPDPMRRPKRINPEARTEAFSRIALT